MPSVQSPVFSFSAFIYLVFLKYCYCYQWLIYNLKSIYMLIGCYEYSLQTNRLEVTVMRAMHPM